MLDIYVVSGNNIFTPIDLVDNIVLPVTYNSTNYEVIIDKSTKSLKIQEA
jgi:hypothetical protein